jgi:uncharacterized membrane protein
MTSMLVYGATVLLAVAYAIFFAWLSIQRYNTFQMHALDMGNLDQAVWNTLHGHPFRFTNMEQPLPKEAWGTTSRLSFHVEPILLPISLLYLISAGPPTLIIAQAVAVALGAPAAARLALRVTGSGWVALAAVISFLLFPAVQAATLYEFHPVTLSVPALLWALVFVEERRYVLFIICAIIAIATKEEIGLVVALLAVWLWLRGGDRRVAIVTALLSAAWSLVAVSVIVPHFAGGPSAYWQRYINSSVETGRISGGFRVLIRFWLQNPSDLMHTIFAPAKFGMLHRLLVSTGYLALFGLPVFLICAPSLGIIILSTDQHMYGGLGHYSAELVPISIGAAIYGIAWIAAVVNSRTGVPRQAVFMLCAIWMAVMAVANSRVNGFTPFSTGYATPVATAHVQLGQRLLQRIPPQASVSAMDQLDPHLSDRSEIYLFPYVADADYVALDVTTNVNPGWPDETFLTAQGLLLSRHWQILAADDGYLILHRTAKLLPAAPQIPAAFYSFAFPQNVAGLEPEAVYGDSLQLLKASVTRSEQVNLRIPDATISTTWRVLRPLPTDTIFSERILNQQGNMINHFEDRLTTDFIKPQTWRVGEIITLESRELGIDANTEGTMGLAVAVYQQLKSGQILPFTPRLVVAQAPANWVIRGHSIEVAQVRVVF